MDLDHPVGVLHDTLEAVLGQHHGHPEVVDEAGDGGQHLLGGGGVERRGGLVEDQDPRVGGEHRTDGDPLLLTARELVRGRGARSSAIPRRSSVSSTRLRMTSGGTASCSMP